MKKSYKLKDQPEQRVGLRELLRMEDEDSELSLEDLAMKSLLRSVGRHPYFALGLDFASTHRIDDTHWDELEDEY